MYGSKKILAVVIARGGSKGIKLKNLKKIRGNTLVKITGMFCKKINIFDKSIISTDHELIGKEGKKNSLDFFFKRPKKLSGSIVADEDVLRHATIKAENFYKTKFDIIVSLPPTSPLRKNIDVINALKILISNNHDAVWTVSETDSKFHPLKQLIIERKRLKFFEKKGKDIIARQQLSKIFHRNGCAYLIKRNVLLQKKKLFTSNTGYLIIKSKQISVDTIDDIKLIESII
jgi:CMP-N-acetylneuraminic acid synthetase